MQRALRRAPNEGLKVDGVFNAAGKTVVKQFHEGAGLTPTAASGNQTSAVSLRVASATLETAVGLNFVID